MKLTIERAALLKALAHVQSVVERRNTIPILSNVLITAQKGRLSLAATDMDLAITESVEASAAKAGSTTAPAHTLYDIVRKLREGAQIERSARMVAPAFIGRDAHISAECLVTRGSNVESNSRVDFGTAVEDSSILSDSYVGIGLDLSHSIVDGHNLLNLRHNVTLEITDPVVMRQNNVRGGNRQSLGSIETRQVALSSAE